MRKIFLIGVVVGSLFFTGCNKAPEVPEEKAKKYSSPIDESLGGIYDKKPEWFFEKNHPHKFIGIGSAALVPEKGHRLQRFESYVAGVENIINKKMMPLIKSIGFKKEKEILVASKKIIRKNSRPKYQHEGSSGILYTYVEVKLDTYLFILDNLNIEMEKSKKTLLKKKLFE